MKVKVKVKVKVEVRVKVMVMVMAMAMVMVMVKVKVKVAHKTGTLYESIRFHALGLGCPDDSQPERLNRDSSRDPCCQRQHDRFSKAG